jgi:hypothetical protein
MEKDSRKYTACQLLYWYRSNEMWKISEIPTLATVSMGHSADVRLSDWSGLDPAGHRVQLAI